MIIFQRIRYKILAYFLPVSLLPLLAWFYVEYKATEAELQQHAQAHLIAVREAKKERLQNYLFSCRSEIAYFAQSDLVVKALQEFTTAFHSIGSTDVTADTWQEVEKFYKQNTRKAQLYKTNGAELLSATPTDFKTIYYQYHYKTNRGVANDLSRYKAVHDKYQAEFARLLDHLGYYDLYLIDNQTGYIVYSLTKEIDFATNLVKGNFKDTHLAEVWREISRTHTREAVKMTDFSLYLPSFNAPTAFLAAPVYDDDVKIGTIVLQISLDEINAVLTGNLNWKNEGMGQSGESFIVGEDGTFRSDVRLLLERPAKFIETMRKNGLSQADIQAMQLHKSNVGILPFAHDLLPDTVRLGVDYKGKSVLMATTPLKVPDVDWLLVVQMENDELFEHLQIFMQRSLLAVLVLAIIITIAVWYLAYKIVQPITLLSEGVKKIAQGNYNVIVPENNQDETVLLAKAFNNMTKALAQQRLEIENQRDELACHNRQLRSLFDEIQQQKEEIESQRDELDLRKKQVEKAFQNIQSSIQYAQRIQQATLPDVTEIRNILPTFFLFYQPRDIVSGDFYWFHHIAHPDGSQTTVIALADCTGHGVPGAFMSLIGNNLLNEIIIRNQTLQPSAILRKLNKEVKTALRQDETRNQDGMEMGICVLEKGIFGSYRKLLYAGAKTDLLYVQNKVLHQIKGDRIRIGGKRNANDIFFKQHEITINVPTSCFLSSDGFADQFGEEIPEKFMSKRFKELLLSIVGETPDEQALILKQTIDDWKGRIPQTDDISVIGFSI